MIKDFILSDESVNSHGLIILTSGIDLTRFRKSPVMGNQHLTDIENIIGKWNNIRFEGTQLIATPDFDLEDPKANLIAGKVERGYINAASIGLDVLEFDDSSSPVVITKSSVYEASIVSIPSNQNAVTLKYNNKELLIGDNTSNESIKLFLSADSSLNKNLKNMKNKDEKVETKVVKLTEVEKLELSIKEKNTKLEELSASKVELGLDITNLNKEIETLKTANESLKLSLTEKETEVEGLNTNVLELKSEKLNVLLDSAIEAGKITKEAKEDFLELSYEKVESILSKILPSEASLVDALNLNKQVNKGTEKTFDWYMDNDVEGLKKLSKENPALYKTLEDNKYKNK